MCVCAETCQARDNDTEMCPYMYLYGPYVSIYVHMCPYMDIYVHMCPYMDTYGTYKDIYGHTYQNTCVLIRPIYVHICPICVLICPICVAQERVKQAIMIQKREMDLQLERQRAEMKVRLRV